MDSEQEYDDAQSDDMPCNEGSQLVDCTDVFITEEVFANRTDLLRWAREVGRRHGIVVVIFRSEKGTGRPGTKTKLILACERSGKYRPWKNPQPVRGAGTKKCECPFRLRGRPLINGQGWTIDVKCGIHNHELAETLSGHSYVGRLSNEEKSLVDDMTKNMVKPRNILLTLKDRNVENLTTIKHVYNARQAYQSSIRGNRTEMQQLITLMERDQYVYRYRKAGDSDELMDIFWAHPDAITLVNTFHLVLIMDSTYKTCRYRLPLLEIVGVTSIEMTFSVVFAYVQSEGIDNFTWALEMLREQITSGEVGVIVTNRDLGLMNAVRLVFPRAVNLLCLFHVSKNVNGKCKTAVFPKEKQEKVMEAWNALVRSSDEADYEQRLGVFQSISMDCSYFHTYVHQTWLIPHKERFVEAWTNRVMHLGNTTTNRIESAHWSLKRILQDSMGDICSVWDALSSLIILQHTEVKASFQKSINVKEHRHSSALYNSLRGFVSRSALAHIANELECVKSVGIDKSLCGCILKTTHGLPCACELAMYSMRPVAIPLNTIHVFWKKLNFTDQDFSKSDEISLEPEIAVIRKRFKELDAPGKRTLKSIMRDIAYPTMTSMCPPIVKVKTKGAPKKGKCKVSDKEKSTRREPSWWERVDASLGCSGSNTCKTQESIQKVHRPKIHTIVRPAVSQPKVIPYLEWFPVGIHPFIDDILDVGDDGNCGYRAVGALLSWGEESWPIIRKESILELEQWRSDYARLFGGEVWVDHFIQSLNVHTSATINNWMTLPEMGHVIATRYNVALVCLSLRQPMTFLPLRGALSFVDTCGERVIVIGHVNECHYVRIFLKPYAPIPPVTNLWRKNCYEEARTWEDPYILRMASWLQIFPRTEDPYVTLDD